MTLPNSTGTARLFPLPNLVLFPQVIQGLHVFEPRYRQLMVDSLASDLLMAIVLLKPDSKKDVEGKPAIESVGCLGKIAWHETLPDGRYNLRLRGLSRVRILDELNTDRLYRIARIELIPDVAPTDPGEAKQLRQSLSEITLPRFEADGAALRQLQELFEGEMTLGQVCDVLAYALPLPLDVKQSLLAEPRTDQRASEIISAIRISAARADRKFPPEFSAN